jgi:hypothetical protein
LESGLELTHLRNTKAKSRKNIELEAVMYREALFRSPMAVIRVYLMNWQVSGWYVARLQGRQEEESNVNALELGDRKSDVTNTEATTLKTLMEEHPKIILL